MTNKNSFGNILNSDMLPLYLVVGLIIILLLFSKGNFTVLQNKSCNNVKDPYGKYLTDDQGNCTVKNNCVTGASPNSVSGLCEKQAQYSSKNNNILDNSISNLSGRNCTNENSKSTLYVTDARGKCTIFNGCQTGYTGGSNTMPCSPIMQKSVAPGSNILCQEEVGCYCPFNSARDMVNKGESYSMCSQPL